jgi:hypothetical protein
MVSSSGETFLTTIFGTTIYDETGRKAITPFQVKYEKLDREARQASEELEPKE